MVSLVRRAKGFLDAEVTAVVTVDGVRSTTLLEIDSCSKMSETLTLNTPYKLPVRRAYNVKAYDAEGELKAHNGKNHIWVEFREGKTLAPGEKYKWWLYYETDRCFRKVDKGGKATTSGFYDIIPQKAYNHVPIPKHLFKYRFVFKNPKPKAAWLLKAIHVAEDNDRKIHSEQKESWGQTEITVPPFSLAAGERLTTHFTWQYCYSNKIGSAASFIFSTVGMTALKSYLGKIGSLVSLSFLTVGLAALKSYLASVLRHIFPG